MKNDEMKNDEQKERRTPITNAGTSDLKPNEPWFGSVLIVFNNFCLISDISE